MCKKNNSQWREAVLICVKKHRNSEGILEFEELKINRKQVLPEYERIWEVSKPTELYHQRIIELLCDGFVVLKVVG